jgi:hypothetical protein
MPGFAGADYYTYHPQDVETETPTNFNDMSLGNFTDFVNRAAQTNADVAAAAITRADSYSWQIAHPEFLRTAENNRLINHWLDTKGITDPTYPDFDAAFEHYKDSGLLDLDAAEMARDKNTPRTYYGVFTKQKFGSIDDLIAMERQAALAQITVSDEEAALEKMPIEQAQALLKEAERQAQHQARIPEIQANGDAWLLLHKEFVDDERNARLMEKQLAANGVTIPTIADYEKAAQQLRASGLLKLNKTELNKQHAAELQRRANEASAVLFDKTTEAEMYNLPLDELERRAKGNFSGM